MKATGALRERFVEAWVEIAFAGNGWVAYDPTPPREQTPEQSDEQTPSDPEPQVVQPPPPPPDRLLRS